MKNQLKKSLSLIMAVFMLMSCWVWVAPDKASAGAPTNYTVTVDFEITDGGSGLFGTDNRPDESTLTVYHYANNGTGTTETSNSKAGGKLTSDDGMTGSLSIDVSGWPSQVYFQVKNTSIGKYVVKVKGIKINGRTVCQGTWTLERSASKGTSDRTWVPNTRGSATADGTAGTVSGTAEGTWDWPRPKINEASASLSTDTLNLTKLGTTTTQSATLTVSGIKDQYGVNWTGSTDVAFSLTAGEGITLGTKATITDNGSNATIKVTPDFQELFKNVGSARLTASWNVNNNTKFGNETITVNFPTYDITFDANGGIIGSNENTGADTVPVSGKKYGEIIGTSPAYRSKAGFEFDGFYTNKNADATGLTASFSGTKFQDSITEVGTQGDITYYAAWKALPVTATFVTADNQLIGTVEGRYGNYLTNTNMYNGLSGLNAAVKAAFKGSEDAKEKLFGTGSTPIYKDGSTTYTFSHWKIIEGYDNAIVDKDHTATLKGDVTFQAVYTKADATKYTVTFEDGEGNILKDANGNAYTKNDYKFRDDVIMPSVEPAKAMGKKYSYEFIGWANKLEGVNFFAVDENNKDESGALIAYTSKDAAEFTVRGDASYVPVFRMIPREYNVTFNYKVDGGATGSVTVGGYHLDDVVKMPEGIKDNYTEGGFRYPVTGWKRSGSNTVEQLENIKVDGDLTLTAAYGAGQGAEYTINFYGKAADGVTDVLLNEGNNIYQHNSAVTVPAVEQTISTKDSLYTFEGWSPEVKTTATADVDYYAQYSKKDYADIHFYNYDGTLIYELDGKENSFFVGDTIPAYSNTVEGENVLPVKEADEIGSYTFTGWADGEGKAVVPGTDKFTGDTYLTAQFETVYKNYSVKFLNDDGTVVSEDEYHYGTPIVVPADPEKEEDADYNYEFRGWTPAVSEVCYGDATYTATYRRKYNYYTVTWLDDTKAVYSSSNYINGAKIQQATINNPVDYEEPSQGYTWVFKHWVQCDANGKDVLEDGNQVIFKRGMKVEGANLYFYPVFIEAENAYTVTFYDEDGTSKLGQVEAKYNDSLYDIADAFNSNVTLKPHTDDVHYIVDGWKNVATNASVTEGTKVTGDVSLKVVYGTADHVMANEDIIHEPTCTETGLANYSCNAPGCKKEWKNVVLLVIPDTAAPKAQIHVGSDVWKSDDTVNLEDIKYINPNTNLLVNAYDLGSDESGLYRGVGKIAYFVSEGVINTSGLTDDDWTTIYDYEAKCQSVLNEVLISKGITALEYAGYAHDASQRDKKAEIDSEVAAILATYKANATGIASNLGLEDGKSYIIYIKVTDREVNGKGNAVIFSSGTLFYGTTAPEITVTGDGFGTKFCADATIKVTDDTEVKLYIDGTEVALNDDGEYKCEAKGVHTVEAVDLNGNKTTKTFEIKGKHSYKHYKIDATCLNAGSEYDICTVCGAKANEDIIDALGHSFTTNYVDKAATCEVDGYRTYVCDNNCGEKLVLKPTDDEAVIAQAKKWVEAAEGETEGKWVALSAADLAELKHTGHDYDGAEWVVDKEATCSATGKQHKDCTKCGILGRVEEEIAIDPDAHKFYRAKVTLEPTCTEEGQKTKSCRYCPYIEVVEYIDALGHLAGEYEVITEATCDVAGSKVLKCARCDIAIGEADEDGNYNTEAPVEVEIPALGHAWQAKGEIYEENGVYYQNYVCANDADHTKKEEVEGYVPPVAATVTFDYNGGKVVTPAVGTEGQEGYVPEAVATNKVISGYVGNAITVAQVGAEPKKTADDTYTYSFAYWATKNADGTYTEVKFPIEVTAEEMTFYAVYAEKYINYTITYYIEKVTAGGGVEITEHKKTGYIHNGETVTLAAGPSKAADWEHNYKFTGWKVNGTDTVYTDTATINGANINLTAEYEGIKRQYVVTYAITSSETLKTYAVTAGDEAVCEITPTKASDSKYHYVFMGWDKADDLAVVKNNIYTTPKFESIEHTYTVSTKSAATCVADEIKTYTCECGYSYDKVINGSALGHDYTGTPVYDAETGKNIIACNRCDSTMEDTRSFTVKFFVNATDAKPIKTVSYILWGTTIDATRLPADPTKDSTSSTDYAFAGWADEDGNIVDLTEVVVKEDMSFYAVFTETTRKYNVTFMYNATDVLKVYTDVSAGSTVVYDGATPVKAPDSNGHYTFNGWSGSTANIQGDVSVTAKFKKEDHNFKTTTLNEATCKNGTGTRYICDCGYFYDVTGKPLPHDYEEVARVEATEKANGYVEYKCKTCDATKREELIYNDNTITISVYVTLNGALKSGVQVEIQPLGGGDPIFATTNSNGVATFKVDEDVVYVCWVVIDGEKIEITLEGASGGNLVGYYNYSDVVDCTCACHRDNIWGAIFRFFHKMIKLFTGEFSCCTNPDPMYG